jgi:hypothetical protein
MVLRFPLPIEINFKNIIFSYTATITCTRKVFLALLPHIYTGPPIQQGFSHRLNGCQVKLESRSRDSRGEQEEREGKGRDGNMKRSTYQRGHFSSGDVQVFVMFMGGWKDLKALVNIRNRCEVWLCSPFKARREHGEQSHRLLGRMGLGKDARGEILHC